MNTLKMHITASIQSLLECGWSFRRIARQLGIHRHTVALYARRGQILGDSKPAKVPAGSRSTSQGWREVILAELEAGLTAQRIWQDLVAEHGFEGSYDSVKRFVRSLKAGTPHRVWRMECLPGEEAQVDFCTGWWLIGPKGRKRKVHVFRTTLSFSRKAYSEAVLRQDTETFLRCLENAFRYFGGVPATLNLDNLKAGVLHAHWYDPELNPKLAEFARHYGTVAIPSRPRKPEHKGKVENNIGYLEGNALKGRSFEGVASLNAFLSHWERNIADLRIHGTIRKQVGSYFLEQEKPHLRPLPSGLFPFFQEGQRQVHRDSYVEVEHSFYEVPPEYIGQTVWSRWDSHMVRVFNLKMEPVVSHARVEPGRFSRVLGAQGRPHATLDESYRYYVGKVSRLGSHAMAWAEALIQQRGPQAIRVLQGLLALTKHYSSAAIDQATAKALELGQWRLQQIHDWLKNPTLEQKSLSFLEVHPLIRDPMEYGLLMEPWQEQPNPATADKPQLQNS